MHTLTLVLTCFWIVLCRFQRGDCRVQKHFIHSVGRRWSGQDPTSVEALLPEHPGYVSIDLVHFIQLLFITRSIILRLAIMGHRLAAAFVRGGMLQLH